jgi:Leucine-rich repeat (LRR) protein
MSQPDPTTLFCEFANSLSAFTNSQEFTCTVKNQKIDSLDFKFEKRPENKRVKRVVLNDDAIKFLPQDIGESFPNMAELKTENSSLMAINSLDFKDMPRLKYLDLSNNELSSIIPETFDNLPSLENLSLKRNNLKHFATPKISQLKVLSLEGNEVILSDFCFFKMIINYFYI